MIVVDVNVLAYLLIPGSRTIDAEALLNHDSVWAAPRLWRSEFRNILSNYLRADALTVAQAVALFDCAAELIGPEEYESESSSVLELSQASKCSAYDCEYVALARFLDVKLVTADKKLARAFPKLAREF